MGNYSGLETAGIVIGGAMFLTFFVVYPISYGVAKAADNEPIFGNTGNGPLTKRHKKHKHKHKNKSFKRK
jgi:hypothetical protein